ncbi:MAG: N-acetyltransferase [Balneolaceae bacterium]|nr:N-acetyltransferase [Balneolaceae bacterium]MBO6547111.1 N-acetyltransferase [Balneolaceae bacterium]MBO6647942.1 N-acetyltransferase [Balneolaceae bacterium]
MEIQHEESNTKGAFFIEKDGARIAEMTYSKNGDYRIIIDHTEVSEAHKGEGFGKALVFRGVEYAREHNLKVLPLCPYARVVFRRNKEEFSDVT